MKQRPPYDVAMEPDQKAGPAPVRPRAGRRRDPELEARVLEAALEIYARHGWAGFNYDAVARAAGCGRPALYRRWASKRDLLLAALTDVDAALDVTDEGSTRDQLASVAAQILRQNLSPGGLASVRMAMDGIEDEELWTEWDAMRRARIRAARQIVRRGVDRGELAPGTSASKLLNSITGAMLSESLTVPPADRAAVRAAARQRAERLVDFLLYEAPGVSEPAAGGASSG
jgi:AcrR family transcriptional regulator